MAKKPSAVELETAAMLAALLAEHGVVQPESVLVVHGQDPIQATELDDSPQRMMFHAQAVVKSLEHPTEFRITQKCKECGDPYTTNYRATAYCSILCAEFHLKKKFGLSWRPNARIKKERWEVLAEPEIVPLKALQAMKLLLTRVEADLGHPIEIDEQAFSQLPSGLLREEPLSLASESLQVQADPVSDSPKSLVPAGRSEQAMDDLLADFFS
jgi:hypothetical protein